MLADPVCVKEAAARIEARPQDKPYDEGYCERGVSARGEEWLHLESNPEEKENVIPCVQCAERGGMSIKIDKGMGIISGRIRGNISDRIPVLLKISREGLDGGLAASAWGGGGRRIISINVSQRSHTC